MSPIVELTLTDPPLFPEILAEGRDVELAIEEVHYFDEDGGCHYVLFWWVWGVDFDEFERLAGADGDVCELERITAVDDRRLYRVTTTPLPEDVMLFPFFRRHDITMLDGHAKRGELFFRLRVSDRASIRALVEKLKRHDAGPVISGIYTERQREDGEGTLTDRQREAIRLAFDRGYFETPSEVTLAELADDLDITPQMLSKHVRTGVRKVVGEWLARSSGEDEEPPS